MTPQFDPATPPASHPASHPATDPATLTPLWQTRGSADPATLARRWAVEAADSEVMLRGEAAGLAEVLTYLPAVLEQALRANGVGEAQIRAQCDGLTLAMNEYISAAQSLASKSGTIGNFLTRISDMIPTGE